MDDRALRKELIKLATKHPETREHLLPLIKKRALADNDHMSIVVRSISKSADKDNWKGGAEGRPHDIMHKSNVGDFDDFDELIAYLETHYGFPGKDGGWLAFEPGRIQLERSENDDGMKPSPQEMADFKKGKRQMWLAEFNVYFEFTAKPYKPDEDEIAKTFGIKKY